jgi:hypothetical protein
MIREATSESIVEFDKTLDKPPPNAKKQDIAELPEWKNAGADFMSQLAARQKRTTG